MTTTSPLGRLGRVLLAPLVAAGLAITALACGNGLDPEHPPQRLTAYRLFEGEPRHHQPAVGVIGYQLNTPLFSDHAEKLRFVKLPPGEAARYAEDGPFEFPVGTIISKTFAFPRIEGEGLRLIETRILWHTADGWIGLPYVWDEGQTEARLEVAGGPVPVRWRDPEGVVHAIDYRVPNSNQCKACHRVDGERMSPIGPRAEQLNGSGGIVAGAAGHEGREPVANQLEHWIGLGVLEGAPELADAPRWPVWDQPTTGSLDRRARAWLDVNCAHCHNPGGPARTSSLDLRYANTDPTLLGVYKSPVAAGRGSGELLHDIEPGDPDRSILVYRLESVDPGVMMPELGRSVLDADGIALIRAWIAEMEDPFVTAGGVEGDAVDSRLDQSRLEFAPVGVGLGR